MRIGIDIDDTITNTSSIVKHYKEIEYPDYNSDKLLPDELFYEFLSKYISVIYKNAKVKDNAAKVIEEFKNHGCEIYIITLREKSSNLMKDTIENLKSNGIIYDDIFFEVYDKGALANELKIDLFIDDHMYNCEDVDKYNIKVIKFKRKEEIQNKFIEFDNWNDIYKYVKEEIWKE